MVRRFSCEGNTMITAIKLSDTAMQALRDAMAKRGARKGKLLASAPPSGTLAYAAWQGAMINCNPYKASIAGLMLMTAEQRAIYREVNTLFEAMPRQVRVAMDKDRAALEGLGVW
jgi:hypothetical protein